MTTPVTLRGRAATPVRPGLVVKSVLMGETPLATGEIVSEAAITDLHSAYQELIKRENAVRPRAKRLRGMTYPSFLKIFKFAQLLHLVELVREEPMQFPPPSGSLYSVRKPNGPHVMISTRRIFKISSLGTADEKSWTNLCKAWIEDWPAPQKAEYLPPVYIPRPPKEKPSKLPPVAEFTPYDWVAIPSTAEFKRLNDHLKLLGGLGLDTIGVADEVARLSHKMFGWTVEIEEGIEDARAIQHTEAVGKGENWLEHVTATKEALLDQDLPRAIENLEVLIA